ncbi:hypothetical protein DPEC_G00228330 [Dallia pectoralis]|uniref:Uncharacterized protein n=1 Tax=Dallia pectoralis TaxID=75939 RepID=A0ACC2G1G8_DALPE|nr:hypothetical protein DPEC_G00228330 [Dallia pectoralis]
MPLALGWFSLGGREERKAANIKERSEATRACWNRSTTPYGNIKTQRHREREAAWQRAYLVHTQCSLAPGTTEAVWVNARRANKPVTMSTELIEDHNDVDQL